VREDLFGMFMGWSIDGSSGCTKQKREAGGCGGG
jgi:hypothetical protein